MKLRQCMIMGIIVSVIMGSMSGCGVKEDGYQQSGQKEQIIESSQIQKEYDETENMGKEKMQPTTVIADNMEAFQSIQGCAVIWDLEENTCTFYNEDKCRKRVSPNSTFKIISALTGIHNQVVVSEDSQMGYDGINYPVDTWNDDLRLKDAFQNSCIWYFRKLIDEVGEDIIQEELNKLSYGNCDISQWNGSGVNPFPELNGFWLESSLLISPTEQVEVLHNIMEEETIYTESEIEILKNIMLLETRDSETIYGKTGAGTDGTAWFIGFTEKENTNTYFAVYLDDVSSGEISGTKAQEIAFHILYRR